MLAQQFVDSSNDGGGAFLLFAVMCFVIVGILFAVDRVRRKAAEDDTTPESDSEPSETATS